MWSITMQMMKKNVRMLIPAGIAVLIGTAFIAATLLFSNALDASMTETQTVLYGDANYAVTPAQNAPDSVYENTVGDFHIDRLEAVDGVEGARPNVEGPITYSSQDRHASGVVIATSRDAKLLPVSIVQGRAPKPDESEAFALPQRLASQWNLKVGDTMVVNSSANTDEAHPEGFAATIVGLTDDPHNAYGFYGGAAVASDGLLARLSGTTSFDEMSATEMYLSIDNANATTLGDAKATIIGDLPQGFRLLSRQQAADEAIKKMSSDGTDVTKQFLLAFGVLALVVAALVIANTFQVLVAQRRKTLALLRTIGATKRQLYVSVLEEAAILGFVASALGVAAGIGLIAAVGASGVLASMQIKIIIDWQVVIVPIVFGVLVTVLASLGAARSATSVTPLEAMRPLELTDQRKMKVGRAVIGLFILLMGMGLVGFSLWMQKDHGDSALLAAVGGCMFSFLGLALTAIFWMSWLMKGAGALVSLCGPSAKLADANIQKNPRRIAATGTALLIGVTLVSTIATGAASAKATMNQALDERYSVDVVVQGGNVPQQAADKAAKVKGVQHSLYVPTALATYETPDGKTMDTLVIGVPSAQVLQSVMNIDLGAVDVDSGHALMPQYDAYDGKRLTFVDGRVTLTEQVSDTNSEDGQMRDGNHADLAVTQRDFRRVTQTTPVVAFVNESMFADGTFQDSGHMLLLKLGGANVPLSQTFDDLTKVFEAYPNVQLGGPVAERQQWETMVNAMLMLLVALLAVAVIVAVIGVANTLSLSVIERTRESATLRAIGMTRGQLRSSLAIEAVLISVVSSVVGMVVGTLFGWLGINMVMSSIATVVYPVDWRTYGIILAIAIVCALVASVFPSRRAAKTPPVEALAEV
ncbi:ABC transporter permease [Bifidobacterium pseudolongum]|uniref:ABC transporter permease n=1 Tax=Bifidobacterium pseudolongum TaxID=1694 RepID=UPI001C3C33F3